jgi:hypothetical protein
VRTRSNAAGAHKTKKMKKINYGRRQVFSTAVKLAILSAKPAGDKIKKFAVVSLQQKAA